MNTKQINDALSFVAEVCLDSYLNDSYEDTVEYMEETLGDLPEDVKDHIKTIISVACF